MRIFLSYPSAEREAASAVSRALAAEGHDVFLDREDLAPGLAFDDAIAAAVEKADLFVFFITPESVAPGRYTLSELRFAERKWPHPTGRVLPVLLRPTGKAAIPPYLLGVTLLVPSGNVAAEVADAVRHMARARRPLARPAVRAAIGGVAVLAAAGAWALSRGAGDRPSAPPSAEATADSTPSDPVAVAIPDDVRRRARLVAPTAEGFVIAAAEPDELIRFDADGRPRGRKLPLPAEPTAIALTPSGKQLLLGTRDSGVVVVDAEGWTVIDALPIERRRIFGGVGAISTRVSSAAFASGTLWITTEGEDGEPGLLRLRRPENRWVPHRAGMYGDTIDPRGLRLRTIRDELWAIAPGAAPPRIYRVVGLTRIDVFSGAALPAMECARDLAGSAAGEVIVTCDGRVQPYHVDGKILRQQGGANVNPLPGAAPGERVEEIAVHADGTTFLARSGYADHPIDRPARAVVESIPASDMRRLLSLERAVVISMAVTDTRVVAVIRRRDGRHDIVSAPREP